MKATPATLVATDRRTQWSHASSLLIAAAQAVKGADTPAAEREAVFQAHVHLERVRAMLQPVEIAP